MGGSYKKIAKVINPLAPLQKMTKGTALAKWTNPPLSGWVSGEKSFNESLRTDGTPIEQSINRWLLNTMGVDKKTTDFYPMTKGLSRNPEYFAQQQQMLNNMRQQQQAKLANLRNQGDIYPAAVTQPAQPTQSATTTPATTTLAQSKVDDTTSTADMPTEFIYKPATAKTNAIAANTFQMPDMSSVKFGGV